MNKISNNIYSGHSQIVLNVLKFSWISIRRKKYTFLSLPGDFLSGERNIFLLSLGDGINPFNFLCCDVASSVSDFEKEKRYEN